MNISPISCKISFRKNINQNNSKTNPINNSQYQPDIPQQTNLFGTIDSTLQLARTEIKPSFKELGTILLEEEEELTSLNSQRKDIEQYTLAAMINASSEDDTRKIEAKRNQKLDELSQKEKLVRKKYNRKIEKLYSEIKERRKI